MILSESVFDEQRCRLRDHERISKTTGLNRVGGGAFGLVFVVIGALIALLGLGVIPANPERFNVPHSIVTIAGVIFASSGVFFWNMVWQEQRQIRSRQNLAKQHPYSLAFADFPWEPTGITKSPWRKATTGLLIVTSMSVFLIPFNWWAWFSEDGVLLVKFIVVIFNLALVVVIIKLIQVILVALKYGQSRLEYPAFPVVTGRSAALRWFPPAGLSHATKITFVLRCVEEWMESFGSGDNRTTEVIHEQKWAATRMTVGPVACRPDYPLDLLFDLPATVPSSRLADELKITFWELEVKAETEGLDFQERYLVPVYPNATMGAL